MADPKKPIVSIVTFLRQPMALDLDEVERAAECAYEVSFNNKQHQIRQMPNKPMFVVQMPAMALGVINSDRPYFADIGKAADALRDFAAKRAIQEHTVWLSVDLMGDPDAVDPADAYSTIGRLVAEFITPATLGIACTPSRKIVAYDPCFLQLLQSGNVMEVFKLGSVSPIVSTAPADPELGAATAEALRRLPEFLAAFANRRPAQGFGIKKKFVEGDSVEHMWVEITRIDGNTMSGRLSNKPGTIRHLSLGDPVTLNTHEIEDWMYTDGQRNVGGFQIPILQRRGKRGP